MSEQGKSQSGISRAQRTNILQYLERNRGNAQYRHAPSAGVSTNKILRPLAKKFGPGRNALQNHWPQIIGEKFARLSRPVAIRGGKTGKTLVIEAKGPACALIQANSSQLLGKINQFLGQGTVTKILVKQGSMKMQKPKVDAQHSPTATPKTTTLITPLPKQMRSRLENDTQNLLKTALDALGQKTRERKH